MSFISNDSIYSFFDTNILSLKKFFIKRIFQMNNESIIENIFYCSDNSIDSSLILIFYFREYKNFVLKKHL